MNHYRDNMLAELGVGPIWKLRQNESASAITEDVTTPLQALAHQYDEEDAVDLTVAKQLDTSINNSVCLVCGYSHTSNPFNMRSNAISSLPTVKLKCLFIYENIFNREDAKTSPFDGAANILFENILRALDLQRGVNTCIASIVKTRANEIGVSVNHTHKGDIVACADCLKKQIELLNPSIIISLGRTAAISLLDSDGDKSMEYLRGRLHQYAGKPLAVTYDPTHLLSHPKDKISVWSDLCLAMNSLIVH